MRGGPFEPPEPTDPGPTDVERDTGVNGELVPKRNQQSVKWDLLGFFFESIN